MSKLEFDKEGKIKLPRIIVEEQKENERIFKEESSIRITRNQISNTTPIKCKLIIEASKRLKNPERIISIFNKAKGKFRHMAELSIEQIDNKKYVVLIVSGMFRCSWCENFRKFLKEEMKIKVINKGSCSDFTKARKY